MSPSVDNIYKPLILTEGANNYVDPYVIVGIGSRESAWGTSFFMKPPGPTGTGDRAKRRPKLPLRPNGLLPDGLGFDRGLMQIDWVAHDLARTGPWQDPEENICSGCRVLRDNVSHVSRQLPGWSPADLLMIAVAGYNAGAGRVVDGVGHMGVAATDPSTAHRGSEPRTSLPKRFISPRARPG